MDPYKLREITLQLLFSIDVGESSEKDLLPFMMKELSVSRKQVREAYAHALGIWEQREVLDAKIAAISRDFALERIGRVERNILRLAEYESLLENAPDRKIVISEALRLTKKFSTPEAVAYVNAILDESTALPPSALPAAQ